VAPQQQQVQGQVLQAGGQDRAPGWQGLLLLQLLLLSLCSCTGGTCTCCGVCSSLL
jgi:hypothetical protein